MVIHRGQLISATLLYVIVILGSRACDALPDASYLQFDDVRQKLEDQKLIFKEDHNHPVLYIRNDANYSQYEDYCPEEIYVTLHIHRVPSEIVHRRCDQKVMNTTKGKCLFNSSQPSEIYICKNKTTYRKIKFKKKRMYQEVFTGCYCSATKRVG